MAKAATTKKVGEAAFTFDPTSFTVSTRGKETLKRSKSDGIDRTPFYDLIRSLDVGQVVEYPTPLDEKASVSLANILRASAKDLGLSISFLTDTARDTEAGTKPDANQHHYAWYVKGAYTPKAKKQA